MLFHLIWTNLRKHRIRTVFGIAGIAFGVAVMVSVSTLLGGAVKMFQQILSSDAEMMVYEKNSADLFFSTVSSEEIDALGRSPYVHHVDPVLFGIVSSLKAPVITCFGVRSNYSRFKGATLISGSLDSFTDTNPVVILGERAAQFLKARPGQSIALGRGTFQVAGILRTRNGFEDGGVFMPWLIAREFFQRQGASTVLVKLKKETQSAPFKKEVSAQWPRLVAMEQMEFRDNYAQFRIIKSTAWAVGACAFLLGGLGVANTLTMSVMLRIRELAVLRVCGFSEKQVAFLILGESGTLTGMGILAGLALGYLGILIVQKIPLFQGYVHAEVDLRTLGWMIVFSLVTSLGGAFYPMRYGMNIKPVDALRFE